MSIMFQRKVYKYKIDLNAYQQKTVVVAPDPQRVTLFAAQGSVLFVWVEVFQDRPEKAAEFVVYATGQEIEEGDSWVGSCQAGAFVWHLYQRGGWD